MSGMATEVPLITFSAKNWKLLRSVLELLAQTREIPSKMHPRWRKVTPTDDDVASINNMLDTGGILETHERTLVFRDSMTRSLEKQWGGDPKAYTKTDRMAVPYCEIQNEFSAAKLVHVQF
jgi:hypothetical protein